MNEPAAATAWSTSLVNRLRGNFTRVDDDAAPPDEYTRQVHGLLPIHEEAAIRIKQLETALQAIVKHQSVIAATMTSVSVTHLIASRALELAEPTQAQS